MNLRIIAIVFAILIASAPHASAVSRTTSQIDVNFKASGDYDERQNLLSETDENNRDTWDPVPQGVYYGGWNQESEFQLAAVPATDFSLILAQVVNVPSEAIMSGASMFRVRLPASTGSAPWFNMTLNIYEIDTTTNWTFEHNETYTNPLEVVPHRLNDFRIAFTEGPHQLVYFSHYMDPDDTSPTNGNAFYTRDNRTYITVDCPIAPGKYYLFVTNVWYAPDQYVQFWVQPDSLSNQRWDRCDIAYYNEIAPDDDVISISSFNMSLGYSFDFINGFGESSCGMNQYFYVGDILSFWAYLDPAEVDMADYVSFMLPFRSKYIKNVDMDVKVWAVDMGDTAHALIIDDSGNSWTDFVLISDAQTLTAGAGGLTNFTGWFRIQVTIQEEGRLRFSLWDLPYLNATGYNDTWFAETRVSWPFTDARWIHDTAFRWNPLEYVSYESAAGKSRIFHWQLFFSLASLDYTWGQTGGASASASTWPDTGEMTYLESIFYSVGSFWLKAGDFIYPLNIPMGSHLRVRGIGLQLLASANWFPDMKGWVLDRLYWIWDGLTALGEFLFFVAAEAIDIFEILVDLVQVLLAIIVIVAAITLALFPSYIAARLGLAVRLTILGRFDEALDEISGSLAAAARTGKAAGGLLKRRAR